MITLYHFNDYRFTIIITVWNFSEQWCWHFAKYLICVWKI